MRTTLLFLLLSFSATISIAQFTPGLVKPPLRFSKHGIPPYQINNQDHNRNDILEKVDSTHQNEFSDIQGAWITIEESHYTYNDANLLTSERYISRNAEDNIIYDGWQDVYGFNDLNLVISDEFSEFEEDKNEWVLYDRISFTYNEDLLIAEEIYSSWNESISEWINEDRYTYQYLSSGLASESIEYDWDENEGIWIESIKTTWTYNEEDQLQIIRQYAKDENSGEWLEFGTLEYEYNDLDLLIRFTVSYNFGQGFEPNSKAEYQYNAEGLVATEVHFQWRDSIWENNTRVDYTYTPSGKQSSYAYFDWDEDTEDWVAFYLEEYTYTPAEDVETLSVSYWDNVTSGWLLEARFRYYYDENVDGSTIAWPVSPVYGPENNTFNKKVLYAVEFGYDPGMSEFFVTDSVFIFYSPTSVAVGDINSVHHAVFPNPTTGHITIYSETILPGSLIYIYNQEGKLVLRERLQHNFTLPVHSLSPGFYTYQVRGNTTLAGKFLKQ